MYKRFICKYSFFYLNSVSNFLKRLQKKQKIKYLSVFQISHDSDWIPVDESNFINSRSINICKDPFCNINCINGNCQFNNRQSVECLCNIGFIGSNCSSRISIGTPKLSETGYIELENTVLQENTNINFEIKPEQTLGLLFFSGNFNNYFGQFILILL